MCVGLNLRHPEQVVVTRIKTPGPERKGICKQVCWREGVGGERKKPFKQPGLRAQTLSQQFTSGRARGLGMGGEGAKFDPGVLWFG